MALTQITTGGVDENINIDSNTLKVDGTNNRVGIGTAAPAKALEISSSATNDGIRIRSTSTTVGHESRIDFCQNGQTLGSNVVGTISGISASGNDGELVFKTVDNGSGYERLRIDSSGRLLLGHSSGRSVGGGTQSLAQIETTSENGLSFVAHRGTNTSGSILILGKSRGTSVGSNTIVANGDELGALRFAGADGTDVQSRGGEISCEVDGTPGSNDMPGRLIFKTSADGASSSTERLRIDSSGRVGIGTASADGTLHVHTATAGSVSANGNADNLIVENSGAGGISILTPNASAGGLFFGSPSDNVGAALRWNYDNNQFAIGPDKSGAHLRLNSGDGVEAMRIDSSGNVGIGITNPGSILHIKENSSNTSPTSHNYPATQSGLFVDNQNTGTNGTFSAVTLRAYNSGSTAQSASIIAQSTSSGFSPDLLFTQRSGSGTQAERMRIDSSGNVGIGTSSPTDHNSFTRIVDINGSGGGALYCRTNGSSSNVGIFGQSGSDVYVINKANGNIRFNVADAEKMRIDSSGRLLVGTTTAPSVGSTQFKLSISGEDFAGSGKAQVRYQSATAGPSMLFAKARGTTASPSIVINGDQLGKIRFYGYDGSDFASLGAEIAAAVDNTPGSNDMPGRLVFSTTADGSQSPTERLRIHSGGQVTIGSTDTGPWDNTSGASTVLNATNVREGLFASSAQDGDVMALNRMGSDGAIIIFYGQGNNEGNVSVSGSTVSYNGGHLSRWSQLVGISQTNKADRPSILRGSVMSNLDELCSWKTVAFDVTVVDENGDETTVGKSLEYAGTADVGETIQYEYEGATYTATVGLEDNEQLNKMQVSSTEGDRNVAGVFQCWDDDDDTIVNDFYCAMTGDFVIRIAQGTTVARGDLLMSAGDGTAKPQDDDIVRSKTIAKVTSTTVSATYADGSYCVPCVLMAC